MSLDSSDINVSKLEYLRLLLQMRLLVWEILDYWMKSHLFNPFQSPNPIFYCLSVSWICVPLWTKYPYIFTLTAEWLLYLFVPKWNSSFPECHAPFFYRSNSICRGSRLLPSPLSTLKDCFEAHPIILPAAILHPKVSSVSIP